MPRLRRPFCIASVFPHQLGLFVAAPFHVIPAFIMLTARWLFGCPPVVADQHQFYMLKPHIGAVPVIRITGRGFQAFRRAGWRKRVIRGKMRLADKRGFITRLPHGPGKTLFADRRVQIDTVVMNPVRAA